MINIQHRQLNRSGIEYEASAKLTLELFNFFTSTSIAHIYLIIPEQFTVKASRPTQLYLRGDPKNEALLFQSTVDIHFQNAHQTLFQSTVDIHFQNMHKTHKNCEGSHSVRLFVETYIKRTIALGRPGVGPHKSRSVLEYYWRLKV